MSLWLDQDPGHDDAIATLLAVSLPNLNLVGISTVHGNGSLVHTTRMRISMEAWPPPLDPRLTPIASLVNAARVLCSFASPEDSERIRIYSGAVRPLLRPVKHDTGACSSSLLLAGAGDRWLNLLPEIHGDDGLGGVEGLFDGDNERVRRKLAESEGQNAVLAMAAAARSMKGGEGDENRLAIVATGTLTK